MVGTRQLKSELIILFTIITVTLFLIDEIILSFSQDSTLKNDNFFLAKKKTKMQAKQNFHHGNYFTLNRKELLLFFSKTKKN